MSFTQAFRSTCSRFEVPSVWCRILESEDRSFPLLPRSLYVTHSVRFQRENVNVSRRICFFDANFELCNGPIFHVMDFVPISTFIHFSHSHMCGKYSVLVCFKISLLLRSLACVFVCVRPSTQRMCRTSLFEVIITRRLAYAMKCFARMGNRTHRFTT